MKKTNRTISIILSIVMLLTLLPTAVMAAVEIEEVRLHIDPPAAGVAADFTPEGENEQFGISSYSKDDYYNGVKWIDVTDLRNVKSLKPGDVFEAGHIYTIRIATYAKNGYAMTREQLDSAFRWYVTGYINDSIDNYPSFLGDSNQVVFLAQFHIPAEISSVSIGGIDTPLPGQTADYDAQIYDRNYALSADEDKGNFHNGIYWYDLTDGKTLAPTDTFVAGHEYRVFFDLLASRNSNFVVDASGNPAVMATVNDHPANVIKYLAEPATREINVYYDFDACEAYAVSAVGIEGLDFPEEGNAPDYSATYAGRGFDFKPTSAGNPFCVNGITWHDETAGYDLTATGTFRAGHSYSVLIHLVPKTGYCFADSVTGRIGSVYGTVTGNASEIVVKYTFSPLALNEIANVTLEGVSAPVLNQFPGYVAIVRGEGYALKDRNDTYYRNGMCWSVIDGESLPVSGSTFAGGKAYQLEIYLVAQEGYEFAATEGGALEVKATVNGKQAAVLGDSKEIFLTCYFPEPTDEETITNVAVTGLSAPVIGAAPDYTADIIDTRYALQEENSANEKNGITWFNNETGNAMKVGLEKFEAGVSYTVVIGLDSSEGYAFSPEVMAYLNERQVDEVTVYSEYEIYLWFTFAALPETAFLDVPTNAYYYEPVVWAVANGITNGTGDGSTFSPDMNCSRAQVVTFLWRAAGAPEPVSTENPFTDIAEGSYYYKAVLWAVENNITTGTGKGKFSPDMDCSRAQIVTFLWRSQTSPAPTGTEIPFTDVQPGQYYTNAVLWAVERGITTGTGNGSTFSPDMICTRAQIVTFLYRCVG
ncbi:MAG: S-layer homology domain-containing protein [Ruminococcaceae bacterium]|nr:S-layer homology domain-containing protein [Oscillospiraceae bacterium]